MAQREFDITIDAGGSVELHVKGFKGKACLEVVKLFEQIVGEIKATEKTSYMRVKEQATDIGQRAAEKARELEDKAGKKLEDMRAHKSN